MAKWTRRGVLGTLLGALGAAATGGRSGLVAEVQQAAEIPVTVDPPKLEVGDPIRFDAERGWIKASAEPRPRCIAKKLKGGESCGRPAVPGGDVCRHHGGMIANLNGGLEEPEFGELFFGGWEPREGKTFRFTREGLSDEVLRESFPGLTLDDLVSGRAVGELMRDRENFWWRIDAIRQIPSLDEIEISASHDGRAVNRNPFMVGKPPLADLWKTQLDTPLPPLHVNCRSVCSPVKKSMDVSGWSAFEVGDQVLIDGKPHTVTSVEYSMSGGQKVEFS